MSSFCWCIIKTDKKFKDHFPDKYKKNSFCCLFDREKNRFLGESLNEDEVFCNIACGYDEFPILHESGILNNDELFFGYAFPKKPKCITDAMFEQARIEFKQRLDALQDIIFDIYSMEHVHGLMFFLAEQGCEYSLSDYEYIDCRLDEISMRIFELIEYHRGLLPAFWFKFQRQ